MSRKSRRRRNRRRNRRRSRRGGQNYGSSAARKGMTSKGRSNIGRWGSKRVSKGRKSKLRAPPSRSAPPPPPRRRCTGPGECSTMKAANESLKLCYSYGEDCKWDGRVAPLKPISKLSRISGNNNISSAKLASKLGVSISAVNTGKKAANVAATKVAAATNAAAKGAAKKAYYCGDKGLSPALRKRGNCDVSNAKPCNPGCVPTIAGGSRRRRRRRRRRSRRRR